MNINKLLENRTYFEPGKVYYQNIGGQRYYFKPESKSSSGKWKGKLVDPHKPNKALNKVASDASTNFNQWNPAPEGEVPPILNNF